MPKYYDFKVAGYYLYFTSFCVIECMHVHASDSKLTEGGSAKFFVKNNGDTVLQNRGILNDREIAKISEFIKDHYQEMYLRWSLYSEKGYYEKWWDTRTPGQVRVSPTNTNLTNLTNRGIIHKIRNKITRAKYGKVFFVSSFPKYDVRNGGSGS